MVSSVVKQHESNRQYDEEGNALEENISGKLYDLTGVSVWADDAKTKYKELGTYMSEVAEKWDQIDAETQTKALEAMFGKNRSNIGAAIIGNIQAYKDTMSTLTDDDTLKSADKELETASQSVSFHLNALKETWTGVAQNLFQTDQMNAFIDALRVLSTIIQKATSVLGLFGSSAAVFLIFDVIKSKIKGTTPLISKFTNSLVGAGKGLFDLVTVSKELSAEGAGSFLDNFFELGGSASIAGVLTGIVAAIGALVLITHKFSKEKQFSEILSDFTDSSGKLDSAKDELESVNSELETTRNRIEELESKKSLTLTEQSELANLKAQNKELENQAKIQERLVENAQRQAETDAGKVLNADLVTDYSKKSTIGTSTTTSATVYGTSNIEEATINNIEHIKELKEEERKAQEEYAQVMADDKSTLQQQENARAKLESIQKDITDIDNQVSENIKSLQSVSDVYLKSSDQNLVERGEVIQDIIDAYANIDASTLDKNISAMDSFFSTTSGEVLKQQLIDIAKSGGDVSIALREMGVSLEDIGLEGNRSEALTQYFKDLANSAGEAASATKQVEEAITSYSDVEESLKSPDKGSGYNSIVSSWKKIKEEMDSGLIGTDQAKDFIRYFTGDLDEDATAEEIKKKYKSIRKKANRWFAEDDGDKDNPDTAYGVKQFIKDFNGTKGVGTINWDKRTFDFSDGIKNTEDAAKKLGVSVSVVEDMFKRLEDYGFDFSKFFFNDESKETFANTLDGLQGLYDSMEDGAEKDALGKKLEGYRKTLEDDKVNNKILMQIQFEYDKAQLDQEIQEIQNEINQDPNGGTSAQYTALNTKNREVLLGAREYSGYKTGMDVGYDQISEYRKGLQSQISAQNSDEENIVIQKQIAGIYQLQTAYQEYFATLSDEEKKKFDWNTFMQTDQASQVFQAIQSQYGNLELVLNSLNYQPKVKVDTSEVEKKLADTDFDKNGERTIIYKADVSGVETEVKAVQDKDGNIKYYANIDGAEVELKQIETSNGVIYVTADTSQAEEDIDNATDGGGKETEINLVIASDNSKAMKSIEEVDKKEISPKDAKINTSGKGLHAVADINAQGNPRDKEFTITTHYKTTGKPPSGGGDSLSGTAHAGGSLSDLDLDYSSMPQNWKTSHSDVALVGEEAPEIVATRNGYWYTVGDSGAEFASIPKGSVVFNATQTRKLLKNGHINSRGKSALGGTAYKKGSSKEDKKLTSLENKLTKYTTRADYNSDIGSIGGAISNYYKALNKALNGIKKVAKKSVQTVKGYIADYINKLKELRSEQLKTKTESIDMFTKIGTAPSVSADTTEIGLSMANNQLGFENSQIREENDAYAGYVKNVGSDTDKISGNATKAIKNAQKKKKKNKKYQKALKNAKAAIANRKKVSSGDLKVVNKVNRSVYAKLIAYNQQIDTLENAKLEQALSYAENSSKIYSNRYEKLENKNSLADSRSKYYADLAKNATSIVGEAGYKTANSYVDKQTEQDADKVKNTSNFISGLNKDLKSYSSTISKGSSTKKLKKQKKNVRTAVNKAINSAKSAASSGKEISATVIEALAKYYSQGFVSASFYQACVNYNTALAQKQAAIAQLEIDKAAYEAQKVSAVKEKMSNVSSYYDSKSKMAEEGNKVIGSYEYSAKQTTLRNIEQENLVAMQKILDKGVKDGTIKKYSQDWFDMQLKIEQSKNKVKEFNAEILEIQLEEKFDRAIKKAEDYIDKLDTIKRLISREMVYDKSGKMTDMGMLSLALDSRSLAKEQGNLEKLMSKRNEIIKEYDNGNKDYFGDKTFDEMMEENSKSILSTFTNMNTIRQSILDLVTGQAEAELSALQKVIDKRKEALQKKKE